MPVDEGTGDRRKRFKDLSAQEQQRRITAAERAGRLSAEKAAAARRHWNLPKTETQKRADRAATTYVAEHNTGLFAGTPAALVKPTRGVPSKSPVDIQRQEQLDQRRRTSRATRPEDFRAPPPPPKLGMKGNRTPEYKARRAYNWALGAPVVPEAREMLTRTMTPERRHQRDEARAPLPPEVVDILKKVPFRQGWSEKLPGQIKDFLMDPEDWADVEETVAAAGQTSMTASDWVANRMGSRGKLWDDLTPAEKAQLKKQLGPEDFAKVQAMGIDQNVFDAVGKVASKFITNVSQGAIGLAPGVAAIGLHPEETGGQMLDFYGAFYEPLAKGDLNGFRKNLAENPDMALDWLGGLGLVRGGIFRGSLALQAAKRAEELGHTREGAMLRSLATGKTIEDIHTLTAEGVPSKQAVWRKPVHERYHKTVSGEDTAQVRHAPNSALGRDITDGWDRFLRGTAKTPGFKRAGKYAVERRRRKGIRDEEEFTRDRLMGEINGFRADARKVQKSKGLSMAFDRLLLYGGDEAASVANKIDTEIQNRVARGADKTDMEIEELKTLQLAKKELENPSEELLQAVDRGRAIANGSEMTLKRAGLLSERTAEKMLLRPAQYLEPDVKVSSPVRDMFISEMTEAGIDPVAIDAAINYLDANAVAYSRRAGGDVPPEAFYTEMYSRVKAIGHEDINDMFQGWDEPDYDPEDVLLQRGDKPPQQISAEKRAKHEEAFNALTSEDPEIKAAAWERVQPKGRNPNAQDITPRKKVDRVSARIPNPDHRLVFSRWYKDIWPEFAAKFGDNVEEAVRGFLASQVGMSPADGVMALLKVLEYKHEVGVWPPGGMLSPNTEAIVNAWRNANLGVDPIGMAAKISDFFDSAYGAETRSWLDGMPMSKEQRKLSAPGVVDRWSLRSDGYVDRSSYAYLKSQNVDAPNPAVLDDTNKRLGELKKIEAGDPDKKRKPRPLTEAEEAERAELITTRDEQRKILDDFYDVSSGPDEWQYEASSIRLNEMRNLMNDEGFDGRSDWSIDEVQALDWFATRVEWGELNGGWSDTWTRNTYNIVGDLIGEQVLDWLGEGARGAIVMESTYSGSTGRVKILGTESQGEAIAQRIAKETGQHAYTFYEGGMGPRKKNLPGGKQKMLPRRHGIDIDVGDADTFNLVKGEIKNLEDRGLLLLPYGNGTIRIMFTDHDGRLPKAGLTKQGKPKTLQTAEAIAERDELATALADLGVQTRPVSTIMEVTRGAAKPDRGLYRGHDPRGILSRASAKRRASESGVRAMAGRRDAERFIDAMERNSRSWSLSPRTVEEFLDGGYRGFITEDGNAGSAISPSGEIVSVFNTDSFKGAGGHVLVEALANGGTWLQAFDGYLPAYYANLGFREVRRMRFDERYAPDGWDYSNGRPDVVYMAYAPHKPITRTSRYETDWREGEKAARAAGIRGAKETPVEETLRMMADRADMEPHQFPDGSVLYQTRRKIVLSSDEKVLKGAIRIDEDGRGELTLTPASDFSTLVHENAHVMLRGSLQWLEKNNDPRLETVMRHLGIEDIDDLLDVSKTREAHELFASLVEVDAYTGRMPAPQLRQIMQDTSSQMRKAYGNTLTAIAGDNHDKVMAMLRDEDVSSLLDDLFNVAFNVEREHNAVFLPRIAPTSRSKVASHLKRLATNVGRGISKPDPSRVVKKGNLNIRWEGGNYAYGPDVIAGYATSVLRHQMAEETASRVFHDVEAIPLERGPDGEWNRPDDHVLFVYGKAPGAARMLDEDLGWSERAAEIEGRIWNPDREPQEIFDDISKSVAEQFEVMSPDFDQLQAESRTTGKLDEYAANNQIRWIPKATFEAYLDAIKGTAQLSAAAQTAMRDFGAVAGVFMQAAEFSNALQRWAMIGKGAYTVTNTVGAAATATIHNPFWVFSIRQIAERMSNYQPSTLRALDELVSAGHMDIVDIATEPKRGIGKWWEKEEKAFRASANAATWAERRIRRAMMDRELHANGYTSEQKIVDLLELSKRSDEPGIAARQDLERISRIAEEAVIRFRGMNNAEKALVRRGFFVYGWLRASLRYTARFPLNHPVMTGAMNAIGRQGWDDLQEMLSKEVGFRGGIPIGPIGSTAKLLDLSSLLPFTAGLDTARMATGVGLQILGRENEQFDNASDLLSQGPALGLALFTGESPSGRSFWDQVATDYGPAHGFSAVPFLKWGMRWYDPNLTETKTYGKQSRWDITASFALGQLWPRDLDIEAAHEVYLKKLPTPIRATIEVQEDYDKLMTAYTNAANQMGGATNEEWTRAANARASYELGSRLKASEWRKLDEDTPGAADIERAKMKAQVLKNFFPPAYEVLRQKQSSSGTTTQQMLDMTDDMYQRFISDDYSDMKKFIGKVSGEAAVEGL